MKILAFADLHSSITAYKKILAKVKKDKPDYILCLGDFTMFEQNIEQIMDKLNDIGVPIYLIHGNHESELIVKKLVKRYPNLTFVHNTVMPLGEYTLVAHGGGGFYGKNGRDKDFESFVKENKDKIKGKIILMTHAPMARTKLDHIKWMNEHVGCESYTQFAEKYKPILILSGHIHETFGITYKKNKTVISSPGPEGLIYLL